MCCQSLFSAYGSAGGSVTVEPEKCFHVGIVLWKLAKTQLQFQLHLQKKKTVDSKYHPCTCCNVAQHLLVLPQVVLTPASLKLGLGFYWENSGLVNLLLPGCEVKWRWLTWLKGHRLQNRMRCEMASETTIMLIWCKWCKKYGMSIKNSGNWNWVEIMWEKHIWGKLCGLVWNYKLICFRCVQGSVPASSGGSGFEMCCMNPWTSFKFSFYEN